MLYKKSTLKQVIYQIKYPNLFFIENKIGDIQLKLMNTFPKSRITIQRNINIMLSNTPNIIPPNSLPEQSKIWEFLTEDESCLLQISSDTLTIISKSYKTYNSDERTNKFRDLIGLVINSFFEIIPMSTVSRIGLRYIDECPILTKSNTWFCEWYQSTFPLSRFTIESAQEMDFKTVISLNQNISIRYSESLKRKKSPDGKSDAEWVLFLDFDGFTQNLPVEDILSKTDDLHIIISAEYEKTIKEPLRDYMKG